MHRHVHNGKHHRNHKNHHPQILYIDDNEDHLLLVKEWLNRSHQEIEIDLEKSGEMALKRTKTRAFDLILLDYKLSHQDGLKLLKQMKRQGVKCPIVILSGQGDESVAVEAIKSGADDYLSKESGNLDKLVHMIEKMVIH